MSENPNYKATLVILDDIEKHGLIQFNRECFDEQYFENFFKLQKAFNFSFAELVTNLDPLDKNYDHHSMFVIYSELSYIVSHLDMMKIFLKIIVNQSKIKGEFNDLSFEIMLKKICNKMQYSEKLKNSIMGLFLSNFQIAINTRQYLIQNTRFVIYPKNTNKVQSISIETLYDYSLQVMAIFDAMVDWSNGEKNQFQKSLILLMN